MNELIFWSWLAAGLAFLTCVVCYFGNKYLSGEEMVVKDTITFECPECKHVIDIPRCSNCKEYERNMYDYPNAKQCWQCDMFHKNFKQRVNPVVLRDDQLEVLRKVQEDK